MNIPEKPTKAVVSVVEMAALCLLSRSRFYSLIDANVFPKPIRTESCKRPVYDHDLQQKCLDIRRTGIGANGLPVLFNRKRKPTKKKRHPKVSSNHPEMLEALKGLGLQTTSESVESALHELFPSGCDNLGEGERVRQVFLHIQRKK